MKVSDSQLSVYLKNLLSFCSNLLTDGLSSSSFELPLSPRSNLYPHGIINPNYPGFQHLAHTLSSDYSDPTNTFSYSDMEDDCFDRNNNDCDEPEKLVETKTNGGDFKSYLNRYESVTDVKLFEECDEDLICSKLSLSTTPPDILYEHTFPQDKQQPDLIKNLKADVVDLPNDDKPVPTNIVGDFGKEVEAEFGVIGYNLGIFRAHDLPSLYQKTTDAALSSAADKTFETKSKLVSHDERPVLSFNNQLLEAESIDFKKMLKHGRSTKASCETLVNQAFSSVNNNGTSSNHKATNSKSAAEAGKCTTILRNRRTRAKEPLFNVESSVHAKP